MKLQTLYWMFSKSRTNILLVLFAFKFNAGFMVKTKYFH